MTHASFLLFLPLPVQRSLVIVPRQILKLLHAICNKTSTSTSASIEQKYRPTRVTIILELEIRDESKTDERLFTFIRDSRSRSFSLSRERERMVHRWMIDDLPISLTSTNYFNDISQSLIDFASWNR